MSPSKQRILFVDDEPAVLAGLQTSLHRQRRRWDLVFAASGEAALAEMRRGEFDIVVSDMRMPGMDGADLLTRVKHEFPATVRIMLTGHADRAAIARALPALHRLLGKPCDGTTLRGVLEHSLATGAVAAEAAIRAVIGKLDKLPSPPAVFYELARVLDAPDASAAAVARVVARDPAMSAKVLQLIGSSYFSNGRAPTSIEDTVAVLGADRLRYIVLSASVFAPLDAEPVPGFSVAQLQQRSVAVAERVERTLGAAAGPHAFVAGLLHDVGRVALAVGMPERFADIVARERDGAVASCDVERELLGVDHAEIGGYLLQIWGVPAPIVEAVRAHHEPSRAPEAARVLAQAIHDAAAIP